MRAAVLSLSCLLAACGAGADAQAPADASVADGSPGPITSSDAGTSDAAGAPDADAGWCPTSGACGVFAGDPQTDPHDCGACGHDCGGGMCEAGACVALPPGVLATGQHDPVAIAVDGSDVYWINAGTYVSLGPKLASKYLGDGQLMKCAITGCNNHPTVLADLKATGRDWMTPSTLTLDAQRVYFSDQGVQSCAKGGCACAPSTVTTTGALGLAVTATSLFATSGDHDVFGCALGACGAPTLLTSSAVGSLAIATDDAAVYWTTDNGTLSTCALAGCGAPSLVWSGQQGTSQAATRSVFVDANNLYWTNSNPMTFGSVMQCAKSDCGGTLVMLADGRDAPDSVVADATTVYWAEGNVYSCAIGGCGGKPSVVASAATSAIAVDATNVYWTEHTTDPDDGRIRFAPK